ncbi:MAG: DUF357 domain-containing protein [Candidatus Woesearchaeota archaeon]
MEDTTDLISKERLAKYFDVTNRAMQKVKIENGDLTIDKETIAKDFFLMAESYFKDAKHFEKEGKIVLAYGALNYAHAWLDAGARLGVFDVDHDNVLFTVD